VLHSEDLATARRDLGRSLGDAGFDRAMVADIQLAMSELATNALTHGRAPDVELAVVADSSPAGAVLVVRHVDHGREDLEDPPTMAEPHEIRGRGRAIVAAIADAFDTIERSGDRVEHVARFARM
jgi:anti-sigma regulatory factor (Ser/Thr protein kinase)